MLLHRPQKCDKRDSAKERYPRSASGVPRIQLRRGRPLYWYLALELGVQQLDARFSTSAWLNMQRPPLASTFATLATCQACLYSTSKYELSHDFDSSSQAYPGVLDRRHVLSKMTSTLDISTHKDELRTQTYYKNLQRQCGTLIHSSWLGICCGM